MPEPDVSIDDFRTLATGYDAHGGHVIVEDHQQISFILQPINWNSALRESLVFSALWATGIYFYWQSQPGEGPYLLLALMGGILCGWPLYLPMLQRLFVPAPFLQIDKRKHTVQCGDGERISGTNIVSVCDILAFDTENSPIHCELQLLIRERNTTRFVLVTASLGEPSRSYFEPFARDLAHRLGVAHFSADLTRNTMRSS